MSQRAIELEAKFDARTVLCCAVLCCASVRCGAVRCGAVRWPQTPFSLPWLLVSPFPPSPPPPLPLRSKLALYGGRPVHLP